CLDPLDVSYGTKFELIAMVNGVVTTYVRNEIDTAERVRNLPWSEERENAVRIAYLGGQIASGAYPRMAAAFAGDSAPVDMEGVLAAGGGGVSGGVRGAWGGGGVGQGGWTGLGGPPWGDPGPAAGPCVVPGGGSPPASLRSAAVIRALISNPACCARTSASRA